MAKFTPNSIDNIYKMIIANITTSPSKMASHIGFRSVYPYLALDYSKSQLNMPSERYVSCKVFWLSCFIIKFYCLYQWIDMKDMKGLDFVRVLVMSESSALFESIYIVWHFRLWKDRRPHRSTECCFNNFDDDDGLKDKFFLWMILSVLKEKWLGIN